VLVYTGAGCGKVFCTNFFLWDDVNVLAPGRDSIGNDIILHCICVKSVVLTVRPILILRNLLWVLCLRLVLLRLRGAVTKTVL